MNSKIQEQVVKYLLDFVEAKEISILTNTSVSYINDIRIKLGIISHDQYVKTTMTRLLLEGKKNYFEIAKELLISKKTVQRFNQKFKIRPEMQSDNISPHYNKPTDKEIEEIKYLLSSSVKTMSSIAWMYNVSPETVYKINRTYNCRIKKKEIVNTLEKRVYRYRGRHPEMTITEIAHRFNISKSTVNRILNKNKK